MGIGGLESAISGLRVAQQQINVISNNVSNVGTPGFTRKILPQSATVALGTGIGVAADPIIRQVDLRLERDYWTQVSSSNFHDVQATYFNRIQQFHGPPESESSIAAAIANLRDNFIALSTTPDDQFILQDTVNQAVTTANKINDFSALVTQLRNDAQDEIEVSINQINGLLAQIAELNIQVKTNISLGKTTAAIEDQRDEAVRKLSEEIEVDFFTRSSGVMVIQTNQGAQLADERAETLFFAPTPLGPASYYPSSAAGIHIGGDPSSSPVTFDITETTPNGRIGALLNMRDNILPQHLAQIDELAHKMAMRFDAQGVRLFTDAGGQIPADTAPIPDPPGPLTPVEYVGFASQIQVNEAIIADNSLLRNSTLPGISVQNGSNEFIRRIADFTFGDIEYQEAQGSVDVRVAALPDTLQNVFNLYPQARMVGEVDLVSLSAGGPLYNAPDNPFIPPSGPPVTDDFILRLDPGGAFDAPLTIDLQTADTNFPIPPAINGAESLINEINAQITALGPPWDTSTTASLNSYGQLVIESTMNVGIESGSMGDIGLTYLGLEAEVITAENPYFEVQVGSDDRERIEIVATDTEVDLLAKLNAVQGLQASIDPATGFLSFRPGPNFGGDLKVFAGSILSNPGGNTVIEQLLGSNKPIVDANHPPFRTLELGPNASIETEIVSAQSLITFSQKMISVQTQKAGLNDEQFNDESSFRDLLQRQFLDESGVNIDEELANLIVVQTAFSASARTVTALEDMFAELISIVR